MTKPTTKTRDSARSFYREIKDMDKFKELSEVQLRNLSQLFLFYHDTYNVEIDYGTVTVERFKGRDTDRAAYLKTLPDNVLCLFTKDHVVKVIK